MLLAPLPRCCSSHGHGSTATPPGCRPASKKAFLADTEPLGQMYCAAALLSAGLAAPAESSSCSCCWEEGKTACERRRLPAVLQQYLGRGLRALGWQLHPHGAKDTQAASEGAELRCPLAVPPIRFSWCQERRVREQSSRAGASRGESVVLKLTKTNLPGAISSYCYFSMLGLQYSELKVLYCSVICIRCVYLLLHAATHRSLHCHRLLITAVCILPDLLKKSALVQND